MLVRWVEWQLHDVSEGHGDEAAEEHSHIQTQRHKRTRKCAFFVVLDVFRGERHDDCGVVAVGEREECMHDEDEDNVLK